MLPGAAAALALPVPAVARPAIAAAPNVLGRELIEDALRLVGVLGPGQCACHDDLEYCGRVGARMMASWMAEPVPPLGYGGLAFERHFVRELAREIAPVYVNKSQLSLLCALPARVNSMVSHEGALYVACDDGHIYAIRGDGVHYRLTSRG